MTKRITPLMLAAVAALLIPQVAATDLSVDALAFVQFGDTTSSPTGVPGNTSEAQEQCPFYVYSDWGSDLNHFVPEGWMGDVDDIMFDDNYQLDRDRANVIQIEYSPSGRNRWAGIYWWDPPGSDWAKLDGGFDLSCATRLTFWARGQIGGEKAEIKVGGLKGRYRDSLQPARSAGPIVLTNEWVQYTLNLRGRDLSHIIGGLVWVTNRRDNPTGATILLDDIRFER